MPTVLAAFKSVVFSGTSAVLSVDDQFYHISKRSFLLTDDDSIEFAFLYAGFRIYTFFLVYEMKPACAHR